MGLRNELKKVQHRATKMVPDLKDLPYEKRLHQLKLPTIAFRHLRGDMINVYKYASEIYSHHLLNFQQTCQTRSNGFKLNRIRCETAKFQNLNAFKNRLDKFWMNQPLKFNASATHHLMPNYDNLYIRPAYSLADAKPT